MYKNLFSWAFFSQIGSNGVKSENTGELLPQITMIFEGYGFRQL